MKTILIVDDEPHMRRLLEFALSRVGAPIAQAASGPEALARFQQGDIGLLIVDVGMDGMDGIETVHQLRALPGGSDVPVIMLTGRGHPSTRDKAGTLGVPVFLTKPFSPTELVAHAQRFLAT